VFAVALLALPELANLARFVSERAAGPPQYFRQFWLVGVNFSRELFAVAGDFAPLGRFPGGQRLCLFLWFREAIPPGHCLQSLSLPGRVTPEVLSDALNARVNPIPELLVSSMANRERLGVLGIKPYPI
jgi:hypothetical protein